MENYKRMRFRKKGKPHGMQAKQKKITKKAQAKT
ncbi:MAG: hypothetical protein ACJA0Q_001959 [Saprospiraceae bacterium]|jgi:hypothetical protein